MKLTTLKVIPLETITFSVDKRKELRNCLDRGVRDTESKTRPDYLLELSKDGFKKHPISSHFGSYSPRN